MHPRTRHRKSGAPHGRGLAALALAALAGCGGSSNPAVVVPAGPRAVNPATGLAYVPEAHRGGQASNLRLIGVSWGRLVDVREASGTLLHRDFVIGPDIVSDAVDFALERNAFTGSETLTILHPEGTPAFDAAFARLEANLVDWLDKGLAATELPPFTMVARNAALVVRFDDLLADGGNPGEPGFPGTVTTETVRLVVGYPPEATFPARVFPDPNHGDLVAGRFHSTRVIVDLSVSQLEVQAEGGFVNVLGLPESALATAPNVALRIPTSPSPASPQPEVLENLSGGRVAFLGNGPNDPTSPTLDVVRAARSGGAAVGDPHNGFLPDSIPPRVIGAQAVSVDLAPDPSGSGYRADLTFGTPLCAAAATEGDVLELPSHALVVTADSKAPLGGVTRAVALELLTGSAAALSGPVTVVGRYRSAFDPSTGPPPECFVRFSPAPTQPPAGGVAVDADVIVSFSEPIDPASVAPSSSLVLEYGASPDPSPLYRRVVGIATASPDLAEYAFGPSHPLKHHGDPTLAPEAYALHVLGASAAGGGVRDLAGNSIADELADLRLTIDPAEPRVESGGLMLDFGALDEDGDGSPEVRGQLFHDAVRGVVRPRPSDRFSAAVNETQVMLTASNLVAKPVQTPLSNHGSKLQTVWRYADMGFGLLDDAGHNLDLEGLWWEPFGGVPKLDFFPEFELRVAHAAYSPDEGLDTGLLPRFPASGLSNTFDENYADLPAVLHARSSGYQIQPQVVHSEQGRSIAAWPFNQEVAPGEFTYWTWRDTAKLMVGAPGGTGVDTLAATQKLGAGVTMRGFYRAGEVPSIGLPLLMEFRTYPNSVSTAQNGFQIAYPIASSANPFFRTYSTGGVLNGVVHQVDPDTETEGNGGIDPVLNVKTVSQDLNIYFGQADFVVRVSRAHTAWLDTLAIGSRFAPAAVEPRVLPDGTQLALAFRGASGLTSTGVGTEPWRGAQNLSPYGDAYTALQWQHLGLSDHSFAVTHWPDPADPGWTADPGDLDGARWVQVRVSMVSNTESGVSPELSAIGLSFLR